LRCADSFNDSFIANLLTECAGELILKIGQYLTEL